MTLRLPLIPSYRLLPQSDASMNTALSPLLNDGSYLDTCIDSPLRRTSAINSTALSTAFPPLYKHALLTGNGAQTLDL
jgi:hypothetical protein